jgi:multisubunit Na+/H+ antiporter MnhC subunit
LDAGVRKKSWAWVVVQRWMAYSLPLALLLTAAFVAAAAAAAAAVGCYAAGFDDKSAYAQCIFAYSPGQ